MTCISDPPKFTIRVNNTEVTYGQRGVNIFANYTGTDPEYVLLQKGRADIKAERDSNVTWQIHTQKKQVSILIKGNICYNVLQCNPGHCMYL